LLDSLLQETDPCLVFYQREDIKYKEMVEDSENPFLSMVDENQSRKTITGVLHCQQWINLG